MEDITILVCDDESSIVDAIAIYLKQEGYQVIKSYNGQEALVALNENKIHLVIIDIMMPMLNGLEATLEIRKNSNIPIIMLSAKSENTDKVIGLNFGADDYITKPFNPLELIARVKSHIRRFTQLGSIEIKEDIIINFGLELDLSKKELKVDGEAVKLTPTEYKIVEFLMRNLGHVFSTDELYERVWNEVALSYESTVAVHVRRIREKIEIDPKRPKYLKVVWGIGYKIEKY